MVFDKCRNTKQQGNIGLGAAIQYFTLNGYIVSLPLNDSQDYDLIVDDGKNLLKVQVKTTKQVTKYNRFVVNLRVFGGNSKENYVHKKGDEIIYDLLFVLCDDGTTYLIPKSIIQGQKSTVTLGKQYSQFKI